MWKTFFQAFGLQHGTFRYFGPSRTHFRYTLHFRCFFWPSITRLCYWCSRPTIVCHTSSWLVHLVYFPVYCISSTIAAYPLSSSHAFVSFSAIHDSDKLWPIPTTSLASAIRCHYHSQSRNQLYFIGICFPLPSLDLCLVFESGMVQEFSSLPWLL